MSYLYFTKLAISDWDMGIVIFKQGELNSPICILNKEEMGRLIKEWNTVLEVKK